MTIDVLNRVMSDNNLSIRFEQNPKEGNISKTTLDQQSAEKVCEILRQNKIGSKIIKGPGTQVKVAVPRDSIQAASSSALIGQDVSKLGVSTVKNPPISDKEAFKSAFSWKNANRPVSPLKAGDKVSYSHNGTPLFDRKWSPFTAQLISKESVYDFPDDYHKKAQVLLNRFLEKNPDFKTEEYKDTHPALMLAALNLTIKTEEELAVWNVDFADVLARDIIDPAGGEQEAIRTIKTIRKDLDSMEQIFLKGIEWNIQCELPIKEEMQSFILEPPVEEAKIEAFFADKPAGSFVIQEKDDTYIVSIKSDNGQVESHAFTFDDKRNPVEISAPSAAASSSSSSAPPLKRESVISLVSDWGGKILVKRDISQDLLNKQVPQSEIKDLLKGKPVGCFIIQKNKGHYVAEIKINEPKNEDESDIETKRVKFIFNKEGQAEKVPRYHGDKPDIQNDYMTLILRQGGTELFS